MAVTAAIVTLAPVAERGSDLQGVPKWCHAARVEDSSQPRSIGGGTTPAPASAMRIAMQVAVLGLDSALVDSRFTAAARARCQHHGHQHHHHHVLIEPDEDPGALAVCSSPPQLRSTRSLVALANCCGASASGVAQSLAPGGVIPLVLLGLASLVERVPMGAPSS